MMSFGEIAIIITVIGIVFAALRIVLLTKPVDRYWLIVILLFPPLGALVFFADRLIRNYWRKNYKG